jgi:hypothetical protein
MIGVEAAAPMGAPIRVKIWRDRLALRRREAAAILVVGRQALFSLTGELGKIRSLDAT